jgi:hypothetical protein
MRKIVLLAALAAVGVVPAQASTSKHPPYKIKPKPYPIRKCATRTDGFHASGTLIKATLTQTSRHRYTGSIEVNVRRANHRAATGNQTYVLAAARVTFHHGVSHISPAAGSHVHLSGTITERSARCTTAGFSPTITVRKVDLRRARR